MAAAKPTINAHIPKTEIITKQLGVFERRVLGFSFLKEGSLGFAFFFNVGPV